MTRFPRKSDIRTQAIVLCACLSFVYFFNLTAPGLLDRAGQIKGTDFIHFYVLGSVALHGPAPALYSVEALAARSVALAPESAGVYYLPIYGPQVALLFAPFAALPYPWALGMWLLITAVTYALCCALVWRRCAALRGERGLVMLVAAASPAFFNLMAHGQNSAIALAAVTLAFLALSRQRNILAGLAIGTLIYKPQLGIVFGCVFALSLEWRVIAGAIASAIAQLGIARLYFGGDVMREYWRALTGIGNIQPLLDVKPYQMHSLFSFWHGVIPWNRLATAIYLICASAVVVAAWRVWRAPASLSLRYAFLLLATVLVSPHLNVYDLVVLAPALLLAADWAVGHPSAAHAPRLQRLLYFSYALPLAGVLTRFTHLQLSVVAMSGLAWTIGSIVLHNRRGDRTGSVEPSRRESCAIDREPASHQNAASRLTIFKVPESTQAPGPARAV